MINRYYIKPGGIDPTKKVYYNRPQLNNVPSYRTYDEGWMYANNIDPYVPITDGIYQQQDLTISPDYLQYYNIFGHKFRFTGLNGGYYDFNTLQYKDVNGIVSSYIAEFQAPVDINAPTVNDGYIIDHLTGLGWRSIRWGSGGVTWESTIDTISIIVLSNWELHPYGDWKVPTLDWAETLFRYDIPNNLYASNRPPFQYDQPDIWVSTTYPTNTTYTYQPQFTGPYTAVSLKSAAGTANRCGVRLHYSRTDYVIQP